MATITWLGSGPNLLASTNANWAGGTKPAAGDVALFDDNGVAVCEWDLTTGGTTFTVDEIVIESTYIHHVDLKAQPIIKGLSLNGELKGGTAPAIQFLIGASPNFFGTYKTYNERFVLIGDNASYTGNAIVFSMTGASSTPTVKFDDGVHPEIRIQSGAFAPDYVAPTGTSGKTSCVSFKILGGTFAPKTAISDSDKLKVFSFTGLLATAINTLDFGQSTLELYASSGAGTVIPTYNATGYSSSFQSYYRKLVLKTATQGHKVQVQDNTLICLDELVIDAGVVLMGPIAQNAQGSEIRVLATPKLHGTWSYNQINMGVYRSPKHSRGPMSLVNGDFHITGKLDVDGLIDPTGLELNPVGSNPGGVAANTLWLNTGDSNKLYHGSSAVGGGGGSGITALTGEVTASGSGSVAATIANSAVVAGKLASNAVTTAKINADAVTSAKIADGAVIAAAIGADAVTAAKIGDAVINSEHIANGAVDLVHMSANSIDSNQYVDASIDTAHIGNNQITNALMADNAIDTAELAASAVETAKINNAAVTADKLASNAVTTVKINADAVTNAKIADDAVDTENIADDAITAALIDDGAVGTAAIADDAVTDDKLANATLAKIDGALPKAGGTMTGEIEATTITLNAVPADPGTANKVRIGESGTTSNMLQVQTDTGYIRLGSNNSNYAHLYTDRASFYFSKPVLVDGGGQIFAFNDGLKLGTGTSASGGTVAITVANGSEDITVAGDIAVGGTVDGIDIATDVAANTAKVTNATHSGEVTGATALTIADNVVDEANLKVSNAPSNGYALTAQSGNTGGLTWAAMGGGAPALQYLRLFMKNKSGNAANYVVGNAYVILDIANTTNWGESTTGTHNDITVTNASSDHITLAAGGLYHIIATVEFFPASGTNRDMWLVLSTDASSTGQLGTARSQNGVANLKLQHSVYHEVASGGSDDDIYFSLRSNSANSNIIAFNDNRTTIQVTRVGDSTA